MGSGFLGTDASFMLDVIVVALAAILPVLAYSLWLVKGRRNYRAHQRLQTALGAVLLVVVLLFEIDVRLQGGFWTLARRSAYYGHALLAGLLVIHLVFAVSTVLLWGTTLVLAWRRFPRGPRRRGVPPLHEHGGPASSPHSVERAGLPAGPLPGAHSRWHKRLGWLSAAALAGTAVTGLALYYVAFVAD